MMGKMLYSLRPLRFKNLILLPPTVAIAILLYRYGSQIEEYQDDILKGIEPARRNEINLVWRELIDQGRAIATKFDIQEKVVNTTVHGLPQTFKGISQELNHLLKLINNDLQKLQLVTNANSEKLEKLSRKFEAASASRSFYAEINNRIRHALENCGKRLKELGERVGEGINSLRNSEDGLESVRGRVESMCSAMEDDAILRMIRGINGEIQQVKESGEKKVEDVIGATKRSLREVGEEGEERARRFLDIIRENIGILKDYTSRLEKRMSRIDLSRDIFVGEREKAAAKIITESFADLSAFNDDAAIEAGSMEFLLSAEDELLSADVLWIMKMSGVEIHVVTEEGQIPLFREERVPYFGLLPGETLSSYIINASVSSIKAINSDDTNGRYHSREVQKEMFSDTEYMTETLYDFEGNISSTKMYAFSYES